uniref:Phospholipid-transporting ATPase n=1 Tax=Albugo laibachii Nc14 TaxID=890382 RepID=F0W618_9STRA|nr:phospholipidtransporting ATPase putative [Albugo laibachii Nc14]|eukprot:CCA16560.1 phospholipidtransporting ATPase putative [Albugo laibachii Nc14]
MTQTDDSDICDIYWSDLTVGTIVKLHNRETAPADLLVLAVNEPIPEEPAGIFYIETKSLDGETNLKLRHAIKVTANVPNVTAISKLKGFVRCEQPNRVIGRFDGTMTIESFSPGSDVPEIVHEPISIKNIILRGCQLRNTAWMYGIVLNTGSDTKIMQSASSPPIKWSSINQSVNKMIIWLFLMLCFCCAVASTSQIVWLHIEKRDATYHLKWYDIQYGTQWFVSFGYYFLLMYQMIPVSLYVTISMVMFLQAIFMTWDLDLYYEPLDSRMIVRSLGLNEELGQISYVFSDKTGTLTCNVMEFRKCSINGVSYGLGSTEIGRAALKRKGIVVNEQESTNQGTKVPYVNFNDPSLCTILERTENTIVPNCLEANFFLHLSLCHTVVPERIDNSDQVGLSASSPDEQALVSAARYFGYTFESRGLATARIRIRNQAFMSPTTSSEESQLLEYHILNVLEFTSDRKRMSVIVQFPNKDLWLLTKGADNMIFPLLSASENDPEILKKTLDHLETFANDGLRTLTIGWKPLHPEEYADWSREYRLATSSMEEIDKRKNGHANAIDRLMESIEKDLILLGATAIEDKLQANVGPTISNLLRASIKIWMLTGDKEETAINIAYACQLVDNEMQQYIFNHELCPTAETLLKRLTEIQASLVSDKQRITVIIDGECLEIAFGNEECRHVFQQIAMQSDAVVCCRVSPSQKAEIVNVVRTSLPLARTLAIGDGANDVAMIQRAHVGVGICGQEGMQAVNCSDYAIAQFSFLEKLILHHGRLNYKRMSILVGYMFYKNIVMVLAQYFYMFTSGGSGQKFYSEFYFQLYNLSYTSLPIIALGVFDTDIPWSYSQRFPEMYRVGPQMELFNTSIFFKWVMSAIYEAAVICTVSLYGYTDEQEAMESASMVQYGFITFTLVVLVCNVKLCLLQMSWNWLWAACWCLGVMSYLPISIYIASALVTAFPDDFGIADRMLWTSAFWLVICLGICIALLRHASWTIFQRRFYPNLWQIVQEKYVLEVKRNVNLVCDASDGQYVSCDEIATGESLDINTNPGGASLGVENGDVENSVVDVDTRVGENRGYAFSFDPRTTMAESYMSTHSVSSGQSAIQDAEERSCVSSDSPRGTDCNDESLNEEGSFVYWSK